jgi:predicted dehydrogenase
MRYLESTYDSLQLVGLCDTATVRLAAFEGQFPVFEDFDAALHAVRPDVVCVCVNETAHCDVLSAIARHEVSVRLVLCEKPLTETLDQFEQIEELFPADAITVNFVERYSPIVDAFAEWRQANTVDVLRIEFFWGKYRLMDERPTMGVFSEISHPIDLVRGLIGLGEETPFDLLDASTSSSDFSIGEGPVADSVDTSFLLDGRIPVRGHSSFLWQERDRRFVLYCADQSSGELYQAVLTFDKPRWDEDQLEIYRIGAYGERTITHRIAYGNADFPAELDQIFKVARFAAESLRLLADNTDADRLVRIRGARWVQGAIEEMSDRSKANGKAALVSFGTSR